MCGYIGVDMVWVWGLDMVWVCGYGVGMWVWCGYRCGWCGYDVDTGVDMV